MISILMLIIAVMTAYLVGSFPTSFILTKLTKGVDIRELGSKNAGATNVLRVAGKLPAVITLIIDILKGVLVVTVITNFFYQFEENFVYDFYRGLMGLTVVCGHIWSVFLKFKGGKGVATTLGVAMALAPNILLPVLIIWSIVFFASSYVSLASITALISFPIIAAIVGSSVYLVIFSVIICAISTYKHKENIKRLLKGEERKTVLFKKSK